MEKSIKKDGKNYILYNPSNYPWNIVLRVYQFSEEDLLHVRDYCDIYDIVKFQESATYEFIYKYFRDEIDESDLIDWHDVMTLTLLR